jgi:hypothetical protein
VDLQGLRMEEVVAVMEEVAIKQNLLGTLFYRITRESSGQCQTLKNLG